MDVPGVDDLMVLPAYEKGNFLSLNALLFRASLGYVQYLSSSHLAELETVRGMKKIPAEEDDDDDKAIDYFGPPRVEE